MAVLLAIGFLVAAATILWTAKVVVVDLKAGKLGSVSYITISAIVACCAYWATYDYDYYQDSNTHVHGWPVPTIIFQRDNAASPWLDFVGPTMVLGLPMNFILFMLVPSLICLTAATWRDWRFSLRTLLAVTGLASPVLGLATYLMRK